MSKDAKNIFEAQLMFLETIQEMINDEEINLNGDEQLGHELLLAHYREMNTNFQYSTEGGSNPRTKGN